MNGVPVSTVDLKPLLDYWDDQSDRDPRTFQAFDTDKKVDFDGGFLAASPTVNFH